MKSLIASCTLAICLCACTPPPEPGTLEHVKLVTEDVDENRLVHADENHGDWLSYGRNYAEDRFSNLDQITTETINELGLSWSLELGSNRGIEATPIVVDGIMYISGPWSVVWAVDARKGELLWSWDPNVPKDYAKYACCDVVNRGVALYEGKVFVGTLDGRLVAIDAVTGETIWEVLTVDQDKYYTITGAPRVVKGNVIIGNGGAEFGVRGYVSAYDASSGEQVWRTYTVPGDPSEPFESKAMEEAAETWSGEWWKYGGGGTAWDAMAFDPTLDLLYIGTGNGAPWSRLHRSDGEGDNLFLSSILALNPDNGELVWYYQTTPGDSWDFTATQHLILADLEIDGVERQVIMQAPKNGFFYVIDRTNGKFISGEAYAEVTWATGFDDTGRPIVPPENFFVDSPAEIAPTPIGAHNWQPMAFNKNTGLVYIPSRERKQIFEQNPDWEFVPGIWNLGTSWKPNYETYGPYGFLIAWDPVKQQEVWRLPMKHHWNGGVMTTTGNLVFQANGEGNFVAYHAETGEELWSSFLGTAAIGSPVTYTLDGKQYITIVAGWGGVSGLHSAPKGEAAKVRQVGRIYTFALGANNDLPEFDILPEIEPPAFSIESTDEEIALGSSLYGSNCARCHGGGAVSFTGVPDLRRATKEVHEQFLAVVYGARLEKGMPAFGEVLSEDEVKHIQAYIVAQAKAASSGTSG